MNINNRQRRVLQICFVLIVAMALFPPFVTLLPNGAQSSEGYGFLLWPPDGTWSIKPTIDALLLMSQWLGVCLLGGIAIFLTGRDHRSEISKTNGLPDFTGLSIAPGLRLLGPALRVIRGILVAFLVIVGIATLSSLFQMWTMSPILVDHTDWGKLWALMFVKIFAILTILLVNRILKTAINRIYRAHLGRNVDVVVRWRDL